MPNSQGGILVYPSEEITEHSCKDVPCREGMFALSQDIHCQSQCGPGSTPPWQTSAPESIWNQFSNENLGQKWGRTPPGQNMFVSKCVRGHRQTERTSFYRAILLCALARNYFYIWMMSLCVDDIEIFNFTAQVSRIAKSPNNVFLPPADQHTTKQTDKHFSINWQKNCLLLFLVTNCHFLWWETYYYFWEWL